MRKYYHLLPRIIKNDIEDEKSNWKNFIVKNLEECAETVDDVIIINTVRSMRGFTLLGNYKFEKEDKQRIIPLLIEIFFKSNHSYEIKAKILSALTLMCKRDEDLGIKVDYEPFYKMYKEFYFRKNRTIYQQPPVSFFNLFCFVVIKLRKYFDDKCVEEIVNDFESIYCPIENTSTSAILCNFIIFFPTAKTSLDVKKLNVWFKEFMDYWMQVDEVRDDTYFFEMLTYISRDQIGNIDWNPFLEITFTKILGMFNLDYTDASGPSKERVSTVFTGKSSKTVHNIQIKIPVDCMGRCLVWMINASQNCNVLTYFRKLLKSLNVFCHPLNESNRTPPIAMFLCTLSHELVRRLKIEKYKPEKVPKECRLSEEVILDIIGMILPSAKRLLFSKKSHNNSMSCEIFHYLSKISPHKVLDDCLDVIIQSLSNDLESYLASPSLKLSTILVKVILENKNSYKVGMEKLFIIMNLCLEKLNPSDTSRTLKTLEFISNFSSYFCFFKENEYKVKDKSLMKIVRGLEDWCLLFLEKFFSILKNRNAFNSRRIAEFSIGRFFSILSPKLYKKCSEKIKQFVQTNYLPSKIIILSRMCYYASLDYETPGEKLSVFIDFIEKKLVSEEGILIDLTEEELKYYIKFLSGLCSFHVGVFHNIEKLKQILKLIWVKRVDNYKGNKIFPIMAKLLKNVIHSLGTIYIYYPQLSEVKDNDPTELWGKTYEIKDIECKWHIPNNKEIEQVAEIYNTFIEEPIKVLGKIPTNELSWKSRDSYIALLKLRYIISSMRTLLPNIEQNILGGNKRKIFDEKIIKHYKPIDNEKLFITRYKIAELLDKLCDKVRDDENSGVDFQKLLLKTINALFNVDTMNRKINEAVGMKKTKYRYKNFKKKGRYSKILHFLHVVMLMKGRNQFRDMKFSKIHDSLFKHLIFSITSPFNTIRRVSLKYIAVYGEKFGRKIIRDHVLSIVNILSESSNLESEKLKGILNFINVFIVKIVISKDWNLLTKTLLNLCVCFPKKDFDVNMVKSCFNNYYRFLRNFTCWVEFKDKEEGKKKVSSFVEKLFEMFKTSPPNNWILRNRILRIMTHFAEPKLKLNVISLSNIKFLINRLQFNDNIRVTNNLFRVLMLVLGSLKPKKIKNEVKFNRDGFIRAIEFLPKNEEEWKKTLFIDKINFGYSIFNVGIPKEIKKEITSELEFSEETKNFVKEIDKILDEKWVRDILNIIVKDTFFSMSFPLFFKGLFQCFQFPFFVRCQKPLIDILKEKVESQEDEKEINTIMYVLKPLQRQIRFWNDSQIKDVFTFILQIINIVLNNSSFEKNWRSLVRLICGSLHNIDVRKSKFFFDKIFELTKDINSFHQSKQFKILCLVYSLYSEYSWRGYFLFKRLPQICLKIFTSQYARVRNSNALLIGYSIRYNPIRTLNDENSLLDIIIKEYYKIFNERQKNKDDKDIEKRYKNAADTIRIMVIKMSRNLLPSQKKVFIKLFKVLFSFMDSEDKEIISYAKNCIYYIRNSLLTKETVIEILKIIRSDIIYDKNWRKRLFCLHFLSKFSYHHHFFLFRDKEHITFDIFMHLLKDELIEISREAMIKLSELLIIRKIEFVEELSEKFVKDLEEFKKKIKAGEINKLNEKKFHYIIFGLCSIIRSFPYTIPEFLPKILIMLCNFRDSIYYNEIRNVINTEFNVFWKSHANEWRRHKKLFTDEQLEILNCLLFSPTYYI